AQAVTKINFVINHGASWDNNGGSDYLINSTPILTDNPLGQNFNKTLTANETYTFATVDFGFSSPKINTFKGIRIVSLPATGSLKVASADVVVGQLVTDIAQLTFTAANSTASFTYKIVDSADLLSDATYTATFTVGTITAPTGITVSFKKPTDWGTTPVSLWAWTGTNTNLFASWPGIIMTDKGNGFYIYTFASSVTNVNLIFSKNGSPQTVDILGVTQSTCFQQSGLSGAKLTVSTVDCATTGILETKALMKALVFPQPATDRFMVQLPNIADQGNYILSILDLNGKELRKESFSGNHILLERENLSSGLYILHIIAENSGLTFSSKLSFR
ncbi:MAG: starch-binding protein, partial [Paludibacter sp.]